MVALSEIGDEAHEQEDDSETPCVAAVEKVLFPLRLLQVAGIAKKNAKY